MFTKKQKRKQLDELFLTRYVHHCGKREITGILGSIFSNKQTKFTKTTAILSIDYNHRFVCIAEEAENSN